MGRPLRWLVTWLRSAPRVVRSFRRNWVDTPEALLDLAAQHWRANDDLSIGELMLLQTRGEMVYRKTGDKRWAVGCAAIVELLLRWLHRYARPPLSAEDLRHYRDIQRTLLDNRQRLPADVEFKREVRAAVNHVLTRG